MDQKMIRIEEAYEKAVGSIPGHAFSNEWNLCRLEMQRNLAIAFGVESDQFPVWKSGGKRVHNHVESVGKKIDAKPVNK